MKKINKFVSENLLHILIILCGIIVIAIPAFHSNIWFDESYSVALANHSFAEIWQIGAHDVHPILYYYILKIVSIIFGTNIMIYRVLSIIPVVILGIIGMTHISKDFGKKVGILFTFLTFFMPTILVYGIEIRMYTWALLFVSLAMIYLNRFIKNNKTKHMIVFIIFSLLSCYTHYYALICMGIANLLFTIYIIKNNKKIDKKIIKRAVILEIVQVLLYIPWIFAFIIQITNVSNGFWITIKFPDIILDIFNFQFRADNYLNEYITFVFSVILYLYMGYVIVKNGKKIKEDKTPLISLGIYLSVIVLATLASIIMTSAILYDRYLFTITGLLIFPLAYFLIKENNKVIILAICSILLILSIVTTILQVEENYHYSNTNPIEYLEQNVKENDSIVYKNVGEGFVVSTVFNNQNQYFLNENNWNIEEAYKAYSPNMEVAYNINYIINSTEGNIVLIDDCNETLLNKVKETSETELKEVDKKFFKTKYQDYQYNIIVLQK